VGARGPVGSREAIDRVTHNLLVVSKGASLARLRAAARRSGRRAVALAAAAASARVWLRQRVLQHRGEHRALGAPRALARGRARAARRARARRRRRRRELGVERRWRVARALERVEVAPQLGERRARRGAAAAHARGEGGEERGRLVDCAVEDVEEALGGGCAAGRAALAADDEEVRRLRILERKLDAGRTGAARAAGRRASVGEREAGAAARGGSGAHRSSRRSPRARAASLLLARS
jgi:hypothetical protein